MAMTSCSFQYHHVSSASLKRAVRFQLRQLHHNNNIHKVKNSLIPNANHQNQIKDLDRCRILLSSSSYYPIPSSRRCKEDADVAIAVTHPYAKNEEKGHGIKKSEAKKLEVKSDSYSFSRRTPTRPGLRNIAGLSQFYFDIYSCSTADIRSCTKTSNMFLKDDTDQAARRRGLMLELCSSPSTLLDSLDLAYHLENQHENLKNAPKIRRISSDNKKSTQDEENENNSSRNSTPCVISAEEKGRESSWAWATDRIKKVVYALSNHQQKERDLQKQDMSLPFLVEPIVESPPNNLSSPLVEARDDISTLTEGFKRKVIFRRRLSTSVDLPSSSEGRRSFDNNNVEHVGPFAFRRPSSRKVSTKSDKSEDGDSVEKKDQLTAWLRKLHQEALAGGQSSDVFNEASGSDGEGSQNDDDGGDDQKKSVKKSAEDLLQLLEKVIGFKGRNVSHITVEQSVKDLCTVYLDVSDEDKLKFFLKLSEKYGVDHDYVSTAAANLASCKDPDVKLTLEDKLRGALVPQFQWLFTQIGRLENGVKFLVDLRTDLLDAIERSQGNSSLKLLNNSVRDLIGMWFNVGFLNLERVTWQSPCEMLQKISEYEAVHPMRNWTDLKKRVGPNRRCFVYTHNSMPDEPIVVLHVFLTDHIASSVKKIVANHRVRMMSLDGDLPKNAVEDPDSISTAIFYSITSTQRGLKGIELGNYLIKRVVRELQSEFPKMTQYSTLSPIPGFTKWLVSSLRSALKDSSGPPLFTEHELQTLKHIFAKHNPNENVYKVLLDLLKLNAWYSDKNLVRELEKPLMRLCAQYLYVVKRRGYALDPVAHFHLKNGAVMWRINWLGDDSPRGLGQSCGMMVNYRYFLDACEPNSQDYMEEQVIQVSDEVKRLANVISKL